VGIKAPVFINTKYATHMETIIGNLLNKVCSTPATDAKDTNDTRHNSTPLITGSVNTHTTPQGPVYHPYGDYIGVTPDILHNLTQQPITEWGEIVFGDDKAA
jgi:hypothetical protein